jgi:hypothetical protein
MVTVYVPGFEYLWLTLFPDAVAASPKSESTEYDPLVIVDLEEEK